ncbi:ABC transporter permease, partial [Loktanella salsilacus]|uniref:ABC transporter permease n=1 Tax=Loktanella salsilacus TaxID=195913 RepID=UPI003703CBD3
MLTVLEFLSKKIAIAIATMMAVSFLIFIALEVNVEDVAVKVLGQYSTNEQRAAWLLQNGYDDPFLVRYLRWLVDFATGNWGTSTYFRAPVIDMILPRLGASAILAGGALLVIIVFGLGLGVLAGMRPGSVLDRVISVISVITTSIPDFASAVFLSAIFVFWLGWLPGASTMISGFALKEIILPISVLGLYSMGYLARVTRASMVDVMSTHYIRTARLKGAGMPRIVLHHALRNALITPVTVIMLQL